jgi:hypothetical protein
MAAVVIAISGGGALSKCETTPLITVEESLDALTVPGRSPTAYLEHSWAAPLPDYGRVNHK